MFVRLVEQLFGGCHQTNFTQRYGDALVVDTRELKDVKRNGGGRSVVDREKVIKGLEYCCTDGFMMCKRERCPYYGKAPIDSSCRIELEKDALALLKAQEPPKNASISSAIECLLHPQDADDSDMAKAIDTSVRAMRSLRGREPRVMQFSEIMEIYNADPFHIWPYDTPPYLYIQEHPHVRNSSESWAAWREIKDIIEGELFGHTAQSYGKTWRCWMLKPSFQQRQATPWE